MRIDLNSDVGESFGAYTIGADEEILRWVTSANVACGWHGGDPQVMRQTVTRAKALGVAVGAHPSYPDLLGFGRRAMQITRQEARDYMLYQIGALRAFVEASGLTLQHVKPHGAIYNVAAKDRELSLGIAEAVKEAGRRAGLVAVGLPVVYAFLFVILRLQDYSLLIGTAGLFVALALVMWVTRNIDWYAGESR